MRHQYTQVMLGRPASPVQIKQLAQFAAVQSIPLGQIQHQWTFGVRIAGRSERIHGLVGSNVWECDPPHVGFV